MLELDRLLSKGLEEGYAGTTKRETIQRGPFQLEASQYTSPEGGVYRDEWIADRTGGGQEIAQVGESKQTRLYAGGTIGVEELAKLGLTKKDVTNRLKQFIRLSEGKTRLLENYLPEPHGDWQYSYEMMENIKDIPLTIGMETVKYKGRMVFTHVFLHTPVE